VEDRILEIVAKLKRIATRRQELLAELEHLSETPSIAARRRQLVEEVLATDPEQTSLSLELPRSFNLMNEIRRLLDSQPRSTFTAAGIKTKLSIPPSADKNLLRGVGKTGKNRTNSSNWAGLISVKDKAEETLGLRHLGDLIKALHISWYPGHTSPGDASSWEASRNPAWQRLTHACAMDARSGRDLSQSSAAP
jgi:hypothetical protein